MDVELTRCVKRQGCVEHCQVANSRTKEKRVRGPWLLEPTMSQGDETHLCIIIYGVFIF